MTTTLPLIRIVDDDEELRNSQKMLLASLGWSVKTYESALAFLSDDELTRPGCLILDVRMPGMTGLELQQELMRREIKNISIIFLSAHGDIAMATHTMRHGAVDFLEKPVQPQKLLQRVTTAVARTIQKTAREEELTDLRERLGKRLGENVRLPNYFLRVCETRKSPDRLVLRKQQSRCIEHTCRPSLA